MRTADVDQAPIGTEERYYQLVDAFARTVQEIRGCSSERLTTDIEEATSGEISVTVGTRPAGAMQWTSTGAEPEVILRRSPTGAGTATYVSTPRAGEISVTDEEAAAALNVDADTWMQARAAIDAGMAVASRLR